MKTRDKLLRKAQKSDISVDWNNYRRKHNFVNNKSEQKRLFIKQNLLKMQTIQINT